MGTNETTLSAGLATESVVEQDDPVTSEPDGFLFERVESSSRPREGRWQCCNAACCIA